jgi:murein L,D-transpeptidase YcbB/YkuD
VRADFIAGVVLALIAGAARAEPAQTAGQPVLRTPGSAPARAGAPAAAKPSTPGAKPPRAAAKAPSTPESRSAAALALSADPVFDEGTYQRIKAALLSYADIQVRGGWPALPADAKLAPAASGPEVALLRRRLVISDDLAPEQEEGDAYDAALVDAVKRFQLRHGLEANGSVGPQTLRALNIPVAARIKQLEASIERLLGMDFVFAERYVVVNIPAAFVEAVSHDKVERRYRVIVGKVDKPSPTLTAYITAVNLNPTWTVPLSITKNEIFRHMRKDPTYLSRMHMRVLGARDEDISPQSIDWSSDRSPNFTIRQDSGTFNALGNLKIDMPNPYSVYMHDTNTRNLFADDYRFDSHGCTRVDNVRDLATWILEDVPGWNRAAIDAGIAAGVLKIVNLPHKMPVAWVYLTGWVTRDGTIQFREDVYKHDESLDRNALADAAAGGFVAPVPRDAKQVSNLDSR